jgi:hypothetical protein
MNLHERAALYAKAFPQYPDSHLHIENGLEKELREIALWIRAPGNINRDDAIDECARVLENRAKILAEHNRIHVTDRWLSGVWILGNDYRGSGYYGSYPPGYLPRITSLFPDMTNVIHLFSGGLPRQATRRLTTVDSKSTSEVKPGIQASVLALPFLEKTYDICYADTPYSDIDAERYATPLPDRRKVLYEIHRIIRPGGFLVWMDTTLPMYRKDMWHWCGAITLWRSTNHRVRGVAIFERML